MSQWVRLLLLPLLLFFTGTLLAEKETVIKLPPDSLEQWYKPANKRQVWLHNMFKLRREMQAVSEYLALGDQALIAKWSERLLKHYRKIDEMVPEWREELSLDWAEQLEQGVKAGDFAAAGKALKELARSCRSCHRDYRAVTAALYRTPDFSKIKVTGEPGMAERDYPEAMTRLARLINRVKIASEDGRFPLAMKSVDQLEVGLKHLGQTCKSCHKEDEPRERFLGKKSMAILEALKQGIQAEDNKVVGKNLGAAAVIACAHCHIVHRSLYDLRSVIIR
ncbi:MAG: cytochrome c [Sedimenticola sp.]